MTTTRVLTASDVDALLQPAECIRAVEEAFRRLALGEVPAPHVLGVHVEGGGFHIKAATMPIGGAHRFAAKSNANFPANPSRSGLPSIQGVIVLADADDGRPLAVMDSGRITELRTAAATAVAARHLARADAAILALVGCGAQARSHLGALAEVRRLERIRLFDKDDGRARALADWAHRQLGVTADLAADVRECAAGVDMIVTLTTSRAVVLAADMVPPGCFVAGVGVDNPEKRELAPALLARAKVVVDVLDQCVAIGDLRLAIAEGAMTAADVHAELGEVVAGLAAGRTDDQEITVFDSTGTALQDVAAASIVYDRAVERRMGLEVALAG